MSSPCYFKPAPAVGADHPVLTADLAIHNARYGETLNGQIVYPKHQFDNPVDPYVVPGDPASGLLPGIEPGLP